MIQCEECEHFVKGPNGQVAFKCSPFGTIKEPECLTKWQLLRLSELSNKVDQMTRSYESILQIYKRLGPLQEKMFRHIEREIDEQEEGESWKLGRREDEEDQDEDDRK